MKKKLIMEFENDAKEVTTISLDNPKSNLNQEKVTQEMNNIIAQNTFLCKGQVVTKAKSAYIVETIKTDLF